MDYKLKLGEIVSSTAGRDAGRYFIVVDIIDDKYVWIADGDLHKVEDPKKKNIKHINKTEKVVEELTIWLRKNKRVRDEDLKRAVRDYEQNKEA